ncbi:MAG: glycosyltransferase family 39 protein, partial [Caldilineaceae bacterium]
MGRFAFTADEAVYSAWARHAFHGDPWFLTVWPDKPPLFLWTLGAAFMTLGNRPEAAQFLNIGFSTLTIAVAGVTARTLWGAPAGVTAAALMALNPFAVSFAPTAFTDPMLVFAGMTALLLAVRG